MADNLAVILIPSPPPSRFRIPNVLWVLPQAFLLLCISLYLSVTLSSLIFGRKVSTKGWQHRGWVCFPHSYSAPILGTISAIVVVLPGNLSCVLTRLVSSTSQKVGDRIKEERLSLLPETLPLEQWVWPGLLIVGLEGGFGLVTPRVGTRLVEEP